MTIYVYGLTRAAVTLPPLPGGVAPDAPIHLICEGDVAAVGCSVSPETLKECSRDPTGLERLVCAHEAVVEAVMQTSSILPMRFCTAYRNEDGLRQTLQRHRDIFVKALGFLDDKTEWGLKVYCDREIVRRSILEGDRTIREMVERIEGKSEGTTYLLRKRVEQLCVTRIEEEMRRLIDAVESEVGVFGVERFPQTTIRVTDDDAWVILNISYLIAQDRVDELIACVNDLNDRYRACGLQCIISGPWPPYGFAGRLIGSSPD